MIANQRSLEILERNQQYVPGGLTSVNRRVDPVLVFVKALGAHMWDADGRRYVDYHAAFAPFFLGHNHPRVLETVEQVLHGGATLTGSGTTVLEGELARRLCEHIPVLEQVIFLNTGSEATSQALRLARAVTGRDDVVVTLGGYNGWYDDVARAVMPGIAQVGPRVSPGEYRFVPMGAGIPKSHRDHTHVVNFNDLESIRYVCERYPVAAVMTEPVLHNVGVIKPQADYLAGLRRLADEYGFVLIFDEVKTGFRHSLGGYSAISGVTPDLVVYGKAVATGFPLAVLGGKRSLLSRFVDPDPARRPLLAGTYNGHPVAVAAALGTLDVLLADDGAIYRHVETLGAAVEQGLAEMLREFGIVGTISRQGSAFVLYLMDHAPRDWHDVVAHHAFDLDRALRRELIERGIYFFPEPCKQCSISSAHTEEDIEVTLAAIRAALHEVVSSQPSLAQP